MADGLSAATPQARVAAIEALRFVHLKQPDTLGRLLDLCADDAPAKEVESDDPFAAFFQGAAVKETRTVGDEAVARIDRAGLPRDAWVALAEALQRHPSCRRLQEAAARWASETRWVDEVAALEALVPPLQAADVPLLAIVAAASPDGRDVLTRHALRPWHARTVQELLNHNGAHHGTVEAIEEGLEEGWLVPDANQAMLLLGLLAGWESDAAPRVAASLIARLPWAVAYQAIDDANARPGLLQWLDAEHPAPAGLGARVAEVLRQRPRIEGWPLARWVDRFGLGSETFDSWGLDDDAAEVLRGRLDGLLSDDEATRLEAWNAAGLLVLEGRHEPNLAQLEAAVIRELPWDAGFVARLAAGRPRLPGLGAAMAQQIEAHGDPEPALSAAHDLDDDALAPVVDALLRYAASQPTVQKPAGPGLVRTQREGIDTDALGRLVDRVSTPERRQQLAAVEPVVGAAS